MRISDWSSDVCSSDLPWWVALEHAQEEISAPVRIALHGLAVASSGDAFQHFTVNGRRYSHTLDPRSGWPVSNVLAGVTVLHRECMWADALATAIYVLGAGAGFQYAPYPGPRARLVVRAAGGLRRRLTRA